MKHEPLVIERTFNAPVERVWRAITDKDQMKQWYFDLADFKPEVGFEFRFEGNNEERCYLHLCRVTEVVPGRKLTYSWRYDGYEGNSFVTFELFPEGEKTRLRLTHEGLETFPVDNPDFAKKNFVQGWTEIVGTLLKNFVEKDTIKKTVEVQAPPAKVWDVLLEPSSIKEWAKAFSEGTHVETTWQPGSEVVWKDGGGNVGAKGVVVLHDRPSMLKVAFYDDVHAGPPAPTGEYTEIYALAEKDGRTLLSIEVGPLPVRDVGTHAPMWDKALGAMKELAEK